MNAALPRSSLHWLPLLLRPCRWLAARKRYGRHVEAKLQQRSSLRLQSRALQVRS